MSAAWHCALWSRCAKFPMLKDALAPYVDAPRETPQDREARTRAAAIAWGAALKVIGEAQEARANKLAEA